MTLSISVNGGRQKHEKINGFHQVQRGKVANEFSLKLICFKERLSENNLFKLSKNATATHATCLFLRKHVTPGDIQLFFNFELVVPALRLLSSFLHYRVIKRGYVLGCMGSPGDPVVYIR